MMEGFNQCIFASSKYYRQAHADALKISEPLGYNFLSKKQQAPIMKSKGPKVCKVLFEKPLIKTLSNKATPIQKIQQHLLVSDSKRKNTYLSANPLAIVNKTTEDICEQLQSVYLTDIDNLNKQAIDFMSSLKSFSDDTLFNINDFALSNYLVFYFGKNPKIKSLTKKILDDQFMEYNVKVLSPSNFFPQNNGEQNLGYQFDQSTIKSKQKIDDLIFKTNKKGLEIDTMFSGFHFFIGDCIAPPSSHEILKEQISNLKYLQFYIYLLTGGVLGKGQNALLKIRGTMRHKTIDFLFLFKLVFSKITLVKPAFSNFLSSEKYLLCEGYISQNGDAIHKFISDNFELLAEHGQEKLLVNPQLIFREQGLADNTKNFNDFLIVRGMKQVLDVFSRNSNLEIYPPKTAIIQKLNSFQYAEQFKQIIQKIEELVPNQEDIKNSGQNQEVVGKNNNNSKGLNASQVNLEQKQATFDIFDIFSKAKVEAKHPQQQQKSLKRPKADESDEIQGLIMERFKQQERIKEQKKKQKKQKEKKQKQKQKQKAEEDPYAYASRFDYAQN